MLPEVKLTGTTLAHHLVLCEAGTQRSEQNQAVESGRAKPESAEVRLDKYFF